MLTYECGSCHTRLFLQEEMFQPRCPICRSTSRLQEEAPPETLTHYACDNCESTFFMAPETQPNDCIVCNAHHFHKVTDVKPDELEERDLSEDAVLVSTRPQTLPGKKLPPMREVYAQQDDTNKKETESAPRTLWVECLWVLLAALVGYSLEGYTGAMVGAAVGVVSSVFFDVVLALTSDALVVALFALSASVFIGFSLWGYVGGAIGFGVGLVTVVVGDNLL